MRPDCSADDAIMRRAESLVNAVPAWARELSLPESPVFVADLWTNSDWSQAETLDCVHPNDAGAQRMGRNWFEALKNILRAN
jgi:lysophospholipase L1-like esterase